jgi:hypothetical protein
MSSRRLSPGALALLGLADSSPSVDVESLSKETGLGTLKEKRRGPPLWGIVGFGVELAP